jgi:hypothetical protein
MWNDGGRNRSWPILMYYPCTGLVALRDTLVRIAGLRIEILTRDLLNTNQERYSLNINIFNAVSAAYATQFRWEDEKSDGYLKIW